MASVLTLADLTTRVRDNIDEATAGYWSDAQIQRKVISRYNELWARIIAVRDDWYKATTSSPITLVSGTSKYALPAGFFRVATIRTTTSGKESVVWRYMSCKDPRFIEGLRADINSDDPGVIYYDIEGTDNIIVSPLPRSGLVGAMDYYVIPTDPTTTFGYITDPLLRYVETGATADCLAKGPLGSIEYWRAENDRSWAILLPLLGAPRSGQNTETALSMFGED